MTRRRLCARGSVVNAAQAPRRDAKLVDSVADHERTDFSATLALGTSQRAMRDAHVT